MSEVSSTNADIPEPRGSGFILVVDNDAEHLVIMAMILQRLGYRVCTANAVNKALDMAYFSPPSLVIADWNLRGMTGLALRSHLRDEERTSNVPVIIMGWNLPAELVEQCSRASTAGCLLKPIQADALYRVVNRFITPRSRRADFRVPTRLPVLVNEEPLDESTGECVTNLSVNGIFLRTGNLYPVDDLIRVQLELHGETVEAEARVVFSCTSGDSGQARGGMGLQFLSMSPGGREVIRRFIHREVSHGLGPGMF